MDATLKERVRARVRDIFTETLSDERARKLTELSEAFPQDAQAVEEIVKQESALAAREPFVFKVPEPGPVQVRVERRTGIAKHEPPPTTKITRYEDSVQYLVAQDYPALADAMKARADEGFKKYGTYLGVNNGRDVAMDMVQETLDAMNYGMQGMLEGRSGLSNPYKLAAIASMQLLGIAERDGEEKKEHFYKLSEFQVEAILDEMSSPLEVSPRNALLLEGMRAWLKHRRGE